MSAHYDLFTRLRANKITNLSLYFINETNIFLMELSIGSINLASYISINIFSPEHVYKYCI